MADGVRYQIGQRIYVLHAFQKKSTKGVKTSRKDEELIQQRYKQAVQQERER